MMFASCTKNESDLAAVQKTEDPTSQKILAFKAKVESGDKSAETMSLDSAVWYVEAALNFTYCIVSEENAEAGADEIYQDSVFFKSEDNNGTISIENVGLAFLSIQHQMLEKLNDVNSTIKFFTAADVELKDGFFKTIFEIHYKISNNKYGGIVIPEYYDITDNWEWGNKLGNCTHTILNHDAVDEIKRCAKSQIPVNTGIYFTNVRFEGRFITALYGETVHNDDIDLGPWGIYMFSTFYTGDLYQPVSTWHYCISDNYCIIYAYETVQALSVVEEIAGNNRKVAYWYLRQDAWIAPMREWGLIRHVLYVGTGISHLGPPTN